MMNCVRCGTTLPEGTMNCPNCGVVSAVSNSLSAPMSTVLANAESAAQGKSEISSPAYQPGQSYASPRSSLADQSGSGMQSASTPPVRRKKSGLRILLILLILLLISGGVGAGVYITTRPQPVIHLSSDYKAGNVYAGSTNTQFRLAGQKFSGNSTISILLDGSLAPGSTPIQSDSNGTINAPLSVTGDWPVGKHIITAKDSAGYLTKAGEQIMIVAPGEAHTPGPGGAPPNDASGQIDVSISVGGELILLVTNSQGKQTVCGSLDDGKPHSKKGSSSGLTYTETIVSSCSGAYAGGKLTYTQTAKSDVIQYSNGVRCSAKGPYKAAQLDGTFSSPTEISGTIARDKVTINCDHSVGDIPVDAQTSSWSGTWSATS